METFFLAVLVILLIGALASGYPVAFALPGSAIITILLASIAGMLFEGDSGAYPGMTPYGGTLIREPIEGLLLDDASIEGGQIQHNPVGFPHRRIRCTQYAATSRSCCAIRPHLDLQDTTRWSCHLEAVAVPNIIRRVE